MQPPKDAHSALPRLRTTEISVRTLVSIELQIVVEEAVADAFAWLSVRSSPKPQAPSPKPGRTIRDLYSTYPYDAHATLIVEHELLIRAIAERESPIASVDALLAGWDTVLVIVAQSRVSQFVTLLSNAELRHVGFVLADGSEPRHMAITLFRQWLVGRQQVHAFHLPTSIAERVERLPDVYRVAVMRALRARPIWNVKRLVNGCDKTRRQVERTFAGCGLPAPALLLRMVSTAEDPSTRGMIDADEAEGDSRRPRRVPRR